MKVLSADFVTSVAASALRQAQGRPEPGRGAGGGIPRDGLAQLALAGRSNVGKSTLINALTRRTIARTSAAPGKTRLANVYRVELQGAFGPGRLALYLVDLPGYGYARGGEKSAAELQAVAESYFAATRLRAAALLLVDSRHPGLEADIHAARWLDSIGVTVHVVATKIDKLTRSERARNLTTIGNTLGTAALPVSAASGEGMDDLWKMIVSIARGADTGE